MNINYSLKAQVIENGLDLLERDVSKSIYFSHFPSVAFLPPYSLKMAQFIDSYYTAYFPNEWKEAKRVNNAYYQRVQRMKRYISHMLSLGTCIWLTFTFNNTFMAKLDAKTRKTYVCRFLKTYNSLYLANIDYGAEKGREHYHAIVLADKVDFGNWKCGSLNGKFVKASDFSPVRIAKYTAKFVNHAIKETTKRSCVIYSRLNVDEFTKQFISNKNKIALDNFILNGVEFLPTVDEDLPFNEVWEQDCLFD